MENPKHKALQGAKSGMKSLPVKDEGYGNISHLAHTTKRGVRRFGKGQGPEGGMHGVSHWSKDPKDKGKKY